MTNLKNGIQDQNTIKRGVNFTDADEAKRNAYTNAVTQAEQILNKAQGPNTAKTVSKLRYKMYNVLKRFER